MPGWVENLNYTVLPSLNLNPKHLSHSHSHSRLSPLCHTHASHESRLSPLCLTLTSFKLTSHSLSFDLLLIVTSHASRCLNFFSSLFSISPSQYRSRPPFMLCFIRYLDYFSFSFAFDCNLLILFLSFVLAFDCNLLIIFFFPISLSFISGSPFIFFAFKFPINSVTSLVTSLVNLIIQFILSIISLA